MLFFHFERTKTHFGGTKTHFLMHCIERANSSFLILSTTHPNFFFCSTALDAQIHLSSSSAQLTRSFEANSSVFFRIQQGYPFCSFFCFHHSFGRYSHPIVRFQCSPSS
ncbi:hypothetical protein NPIL_163211 [Nephila pilipes]|uniref:Uncharacterized protein n=1 Tax=Nephila pilipes TaxID=299642 RepID=A0A8X6UE31_NEPPI|nr:hypothetical protein NPIL_163211 [Nephila pilipes]